MNSVMLLVKLRNYSQNYYYNSGRKQEGNWEITGCSAISQMYGYVKTSDKNITTTHTTLGKHDNVV